MPIRAVIFDKGDTLSRDVVFDREAGAWRVYELSRSPRPVSFEECYRTSLEVWDELLPRRDRSALEVSCRQYQSVVHDRLGLCFDVSPAEMERAFYRTAVTVQWESGAPETLEELGSRGIRVGMLSNTIFDQSLFEEEMRDANLLRYFDLVMCSSRYGIRKPHPLIFEIALTQLGVAAQETLFVGDSPEYDIVGANAAGLVSVWYNPNRAPRPEAPTPMHEIVSLPEVLPLVNHL